MKADKNRMKYFALFFLAVTLFIGCGSSEDLTLEQKQNLDKRIPPEIREILDKAEEITISYNVDKDTMELKVLMSETTPNAEAKVSDSNVKKQFLDSFYADASANSNGAAACFSPRHRLKAKYETKVIELDICYQCSNFRGKSSAGDFSGAIDPQSKSSSIVDAIVKKYGTKVK